MSEEYRKTVRFVLIALGVYVVIAVAAMIWYAHEINKPLNDLYINQPERAQ